MDGDPSTITKVCKKLSREFGVDLGSVQKLGRTAARLEAVEWSLARAEDPPDDTPPSSSRPGRIASFDSLPVERHRRK
jgi:hypothetical protein